MRSLGLRFVGHSTVRVELAGHAVLTDPVLTNRVSALTRVTPPCTVADRADVDLVLLSHLHGDHVHLPSLRLTDLDVALLPVWGWGPTLGPGHLNPRRAATAVDLLKPRVAVPVHWGTLALAGLPKAPGRHGKRMRHLLRHPPLEFAEAVAEQGLSTNVLVTTPGEDVRLSDA